MGYSALYEPNAFLTDINKFALVKICTVGLQIPYVWPKVGQFANGFLDKMAANLLKTIPILTKKRSVYKWVVTKYERILLLASRILVGRISILK